MFFGFQFMIDHASFPDSVSSKFLAPNRVEHLMVDLKNADISQRCLVHQTDCGLGGSEIEDLFVWGPPCPPFSVPQPK